jgi:Zn-dependent alcohol dehydrogenase
VAPFLGTACFADYAVVAEEAAVPVPSDVPFEALAAVGCAVVTGVGAVLGAARVSPGDSVAVVGAGGVGLNVLQAAAIAGCKQVIAVDRHAAPLALAATFGATDAIQVAEGAAAAIRDRTAGRGTDYVFDTVGSPATVAEALAAARKGGTVVVTGLARIDTQAAVRLFPFVMQEKRLIGSVYGSGDPVRDIAHLVSLYRQGRLKLRELVTRAYSLNEINEALAALEAGEGARGMVCPGDARLR